VNFWKYTSWFKSCWGWGTDTQTEMWFHKLTIFPFGKESRLRNRNWKKSISPVDLLFFLPLFKFNFCSFCGVFKVPLLFAVLFLFYFLHLIYTHHCTLCVPLLSLFCISFDAY
jgi:hypothetical protein